MIFIDIFTNTNYNVKDDIIFIAILTNYDYKVKII